MKRELTILHLYPKQMNLYGDRGNILVLKRRAEWRGIKVNIEPYEIGDELPQKPDIIFGGGGQDSGQSRVASDLKNLAPILKAWVESGVPTLVVCGMYQLFGHYFQLFDGKKLDGVGALDIYTTAGKDRLIGNCQVESPKFGSIVGYENHSGITRLQKLAVPLGEGKQGTGNTPNGKYEGAAYKNCIGTYLHGPILPSNPQIADFLIDTAIKWKYDDVELTPLDDKLEWAAHQEAVARPR